MIIPMHFIIHSVIVYKFTKLIILLSGAYQLPPFCLQGNTEHEVSLTLVAADDNSNPAVFLLDSVSTKGGIKNLCISLWIASTSILINSDYVSL